MNIQVEWGLVIPSLPNLSLQGLDKVMYVIDTSFLLLKSAYIRPIPAQLQLHKLSLDKDFAGWMESKFV